MRITRRQLQVSLGVLWVLDGLLQCQPYMFSSGFARQMLVPALQGVPAVVASPLHPLVTLVLAHPVLANAFFATVQILLGVALLVRHHTRVVLSVSIAWALSVWVVGEGLGGLTTGSTMLSGAPGAALLYAVIAILAWPSRQHGDQESPSWWALPAWSLLWLSGAGLQLVSGNNSAMSFTMMLRSAQNGSPRWISDIDHRLQVLRAPTWIVAVIVAIFVLVALWSLVPGWTRHLALGVGIAISLASWLLFQGMGDLTSGRATDPNSGPLIVVLAVAVMGASQTRPRTQFHADAASDAQSDGAEVEPSLTSSIDELSLM